MKIKNVAIFQNENKTSIESFAQKVAIFFQSKGISSSIIYNFDHLKSGEIDLLICLGGDGSMLYCARNIAQAQIPLFGINCGTLGFLSACEKQDIEEGLNSLLNGEYDLTNRLLLQIEVCEPNKSTQQFLALNDCVIRSEHARAFTLQARFNNQKIPSYYGDGVIVATPTGSTAYSLAAGGPIVEPSVEILLVTPICPHSLNQRPLVLASNGTLLLKPSSKSVQNHVYISVDGQLQIPLSLEATVRITQSPVKAKIIRNKTRDFFSIVNQKLNWGIR